MARSQYVYIIWADYCAYCSCSRDLAGIYTVKHEAERDLPKIQERRWTAERVEIRRYKNGIQDD